MKLIKTFFILVFCSLLLLGSERSSAHGGITIDGICTEDWGTSTPGSIHTSQVLLGAGGTEWVYLGEAGDARDDGGNTNSNNDIVEVRFTGDSTHLYFCVKMADITDWQIPNINLAVDTDQSASDDFLSLVGDDTCSSATACEGEESYLIADQANYAERQYNAHYNNNQDFNAESPENILLMHDGAPTTWFPSEDNSAAASNDEDSIEGKISWANLGCGSSPCEHLTINLTSYRNIPGNNDTLDTTFDLPESDGIDVMGGSPGVTQDAWDRDFIDGKLSNFYTVRFDTPTAVSLEATGATNQSTRGSSLAAVFLVCVIGLIGIKRMRPSR